MRGMKVRIIRSDGVTIHKMIPFQAHKNQTISKPQIDLHAIANSIFLLEEELHNDPNIDGLIIPLYHQYDSRLSDKIECLLEFLFGRHLEVTFSENSHSLLAVEEEMSFEEGVTCLFSNGVDSYAGVLNSCGRFKDLTAFFVNHGDQRNLRSLAQRFQNQEFKKLGIKLRITDAPRHGSYTRVSRGALYVLDSFITGHNIIVVSEIGPTMYQPRFTLLDTISLTTHPRVLQLATEIANVVLSKPVTIIKPHEHLTKAEIVSALSSRRMLQSTCSCATTRWASSNAPNCGSCYSCILRRLAFLAAGVNDGKYKSDPKCPFIYTSTGRDNFLQLCKFSIDLLDDFQALPRFEKGLISFYRRTALFQRFALDNLSGLHLLSLQHPHIGIFQKIDNMASRVASIDDLSNRMIELRDTRFKPNYDNFV